MNDDEPDASDNVTNSWVCISMFWGIDLGELPDSLTWNHLLDGKDTEEIDNKEAFHTARL